MLVTFLLYKGSHRSNSASSHTPPSPGSPASSGKDGPTLTEAQYDTVLLAFRALNRAALLNLKFVQVRHVSSCLGRGSEFVSQ